MIKWSTHTFYPIDVFFQKNFKTPLLPVEGIAIISAVKFLLEKPYKCRCPNVSISKIFPSPLHSHTQCMQIRNGSSKRSRFSGDAARNRKQKHYENNQVGIKGGDWSGRRFRLLNPGQSLANHSRFSFVRAGKITFKTKRNSRFIYRVLCEFNETKETASSNPGRFDFIPEEIIMTYILLSCVNDFRNSNKISAFTMLKLYPSPFCFKKTSNIVIFTYILILYVDHHLQHGVICPKRRLIK